MIATGAAKVMATPAPTLLRVVPAKRERNATETKRRILDAAETEFAAKGFDGARLGTIARAADVQQALIHHYFADKGGLYRDVIERALGGMSAESLDILAGLGTEVRSASSLKRSKLGEDELAAIVSAFVEMLLRFYASHGAIVSILRHEAQRGDSMVLGVFVGKVQPVFDAVVGRIEAMRKRGEVRKDVDPRHICVSTVAMVSAPYQEEHLLSAIWPVEVRSPAFFDARKREIVATILGRLLPTPR